MINNLVVIISNTPLIDSLNGCDIRYWNLLGQGEAIHLYINEKPIEGNMLQWKMLKKYDGTCEYILSYIKEILERNISVTLIITEPDIVMSLPSILDNKFIYDGVDSKYVYWRRRYCYLTYKNPVKKLNSLYQSIMHKRLENRIIEKAGSIIFPASADAAWLKKHTNKIHIVGNGTAYTKSNPVQRVCQDSTIGFHGTMSWAPNTSCAEYLINEILPLVRLKSKDTTLKIAGALTNEKLNYHSNKPGVVISGRVDSLREWMASINVYVMPMLQGAGVKNKLIETMALGMPIVTNSHGAEALSESGKNSVLIADSSKEIADAILNLLSDNEKARKLGAKARSIAVKEYSWEIYQKQYNDACAGISFMPEDMTSTKFNK